MEMYGSGGETAERTMSSEYHPRSDDSHEVRRRLGRVLIVGDRLSFVRQYATWLENSYEVQVVTRIHTAFERLNHHPFDVILVDALTLEASTRSSFELASVADRNRQVVLVDADPSTAIHADDYVFRPTNRQTLEEAVGTATAVARYDAAIAELLRLITKRRRLSTSQTSDDAERSGDVRAVNSQICKLTSQIEEELLPVEAEYAELIDRGPKKLQAERMEADR